MTLSPNVNYDDEWTALIVLLQGFLQYFLQGIIFSQAVKYWRRFPEDSMRLKVFVLCLVGFSVSQTAIGSYKVWIVSLRRRHWWSNPLYNVDFFLNGFISTFCQAFLIRRCWKMIGRDKRILIVLVPLAITAFVANVYLMVKSRLLLMSAPVLMDSLRASDWAFPCWVFVSLVLELAVTLIISVSLWKSRTGLNYLDKALNHIIGITWESAALPCICMIVSASLYFSSAKSPNVEHLDVFFIISTAKFYTLGLLRTLNLRVAFRERLTSTDMGRRSLSSWQWNNDKPAISHPPDDMRDQSPTCTTMADTSSADHGNPPMSSTNSTMHVQVTGPLGHPVSPTLPDARAKQVAPRGVEFII